MSLHRELTVTEETSEDYLKVILVGPSVVWARIDKAKLPLNWWGNRNEHLHYTYINETHRWLRIGRVYPTRIEITEDLPGIDREQLEAWAYQALLVCE